MIWIKRFKNASTLLPGVQVFGWLVIIAEAIGLNTEKNMAKEIKIGSIIHLQNGAANGGYLDMRGWITEKPVVQHWYDPHLLAFVSTHEHENRVMGSGSWEILSTHGKSVGEPLLIGDKIYLRNMYTGAGYLDTFEWVQNLAPFKDYPMNIGVFTSSDPERGGGLSGTWTIRSATGKTTNEQLVETDKIYLENDYPGAGFLRTYGKVRDHELFHDYDGQRLFVFTGLVPNPDDGSHTWAVMLSSPPENSYYLWGDVAGDWLDFGVVRVSGLMSQAMTALKAISVDEGKRLTGKVAYRGEGYVDWAAAWVEPNTYEVAHRLNGRNLPSYPNGRWTLGGRDDKKITDIDVASVDNGRSFTGTLTYANESPIPVKGSRATTTLFNKKQRTILYDFFEPALWEARVRKMDVALKTAVTELDEALFTIGGFSVEKLAELLNDAGGSSYAYLARDYIAKGGKDREDDEFGPTYWQLLQRNGRIKDLFQQSQQEPQNNDPALNTAFDHLNEKLLDLLTQTPLPEETTPDALDFEYQVKQLLNIYTLWRSMDEFWQLLSDTSIKCIKQLSEVHILPPVHRIRNCFRQFTIDFEIIQSAIQQRRWAKAAIGSTAGNTLAGSLVITDKLAAMSLAPFQHLLSETAQIIPITYFSKTIHVRQLPYTDQFVFVGLTYDLTSSINNQDDTPAFELMAIPHELGHFMYHHARLVKHKTVTRFADMSQQFAANPYHRWCEEIFADLYGCVVAGPFTVLGLQALLATGDKNRVLLDDEDHPTPLLRPFFLSEMLRILGSQQVDQYDFAEVAMILDANWTAVLERWGFVTETIINGRPARIQLPSHTTTHTEQYINIDQALHNVRPIIETFAKALLTLAQFDPWAANTKEGKLSATIPWCQKHHSLPEYIDQIKQLAGQDFASKKVPHIHLSQQYQLKQSIKDEITAVLRERNDHISSTLFQNILESWHDSGPHGTGGHD